MAKAIDLTGQNFGDLIVLERDFEIQKSILQKDKHGGNVNAMLAEKKKVCEHL